MWGVERQLEFVVEKYRVAHFPLQTAQDLAGNVLKWKWMRFQSFMLNLIYKSECVCVCVCLSVCSRLTL
jgi:hypothetical protein